MIGSAIACASARSWGAWNSKTPDVNNHHRYTFGGSVKQSDSKTKHSHGGRLQMALRCFTWNSQGDFSRQDKLEVVSRLFRTRNCMVGMIQEGGTPLGYANRIRGLQTVVTGQPVGAFNRRCTTYLLSKFDGTEWHGEAIAGGVAGRRPAGLIVRRTLFISWHSTAVNGLDTDTVRLVLDCKRALRNGLCSRVMIGGDFNTSRPNIERIAKYILKPKRGAQYDYSVISPGLHTHTSGRRLDHFLLIWNGTANEFVNAQAVTRREPTSDHRPVLLSTGY